MTSTQSSSALSVDPQVMRVAADCHASTAADYQDYRARFELWADGVKAEILRCHGSVAAPVAEALADHAERVGAQVATAAAHHAVMGEKLAAAAQGYERVDEAGAAAVSAVVV